MARKRNPWPKIRLNKRQQRQIAELRQRRTSLLDIYHALNKKIPYRVLRQFVRGALDDTGDANRARAYGQRLEPAVEQWRLEIREEVLAGRLPSRAAIRGWLAERGVQASDESVWQLVRGL